MGTDPRAEAKQSVLERGMRFMALRGAQRALKPSVRSPDPPGGEAVLQVRDHLKVLGERVLLEADTLSNLSVELAAIDDLLVVMANELLQALESIAIPQLRATLPDTLERYPDEVAALLDLCIGTEHRRSDRVRTSEYLVTLLASERCEGVRHLVADPTQLSNELRDYCATQEAALPPESDPAVIAAQFEAAGERAEQTADPSSVVAELARLKQSLGESIFAPPILRAVVEYNIAIYNRTEDLLDESRTDDWLEDSELLLSMDAPVRDPAAEQDDDKTDLTAPTLPGEKGLARLEAAIGLVARGERLADDLAAEVIDDLELDEAERKVFAVGDESEFATLLRRMIAVGTAYRALSRGSLAAELDFSPALLQPEVQRLNEKMRRQTKKLIAEGKYDLAKVVSGVKQKFLQGTLLEMTRTAIGQRAAEAGPLAAREKRVEGADEVVAKEKAKRQVKRKRRVKQAKRSAAGVLFIVTVALLGWRLSIVQPQPFEIWTPERLVVVSDYIVSGYRGKSGVSQTFFGTVDGRFRKLPIDEQREEGAEMYGRLKREGVREILLYDENRQMRLHLAGDEVRFPKPEQN